MFKNTSSTQEEVTNKFIEEFYKEYLGIENKCLQLCISFIIQSTNEDFWAVANKYLDKSEALPRGIFSLVENLKQTILDLKNRERELEKYKETITDLEHRIRELEVDKKEQGASLSYKKVKDNPGQTKKNSSSRRRKSQKNLDTQHYSNGKITELSDCYNCDEMDVTELRKLMAMNVLKETKDGDNINENKKRVAQIQGSRGDDDSEGSE
ncbi:hypothetical protein RhiirC2_786745 [Rhizophagus irregularis]|uniref:Uncharacterized protein n=1 Tax=Rhizophagus irregularis TaxID=588596 RepID=A0A2N1MTR9_9GLOM|nr:hypothetical protein RhiirC2_786745 [Rhizophagus irregularis]